MFNIHEELKKLPDKSGVYIMKDKNGEIIYIGKAIILKNRVRQYFQSLSNQSPKVAAMVSKIAEFEYIVTDSELEALILECNLIKKYRPKFNILLKDDKSYPYIKVTVNEEFPRIIMTRRILKDGAKYYGPYSNVTAVKETIDLLKELFPIKTCKKVLPRDVGKGRPCLNFFIFKCLAPCQGDVNADEYRGVIKDICGFLAGRQEDIIKRFEVQMKEAAENMEYEKAAGIRNKINSLRHIAEKQRVLSTDFEDRDIIAIAKQQEDACVQIFFVRSGKLIGREHFIFEDISDENVGEVLNSFVKQFYSHTEFIPREIILQSEIDDTELIEKWLTEKRGSRVYIKVPQKGEKVQLIKLVKQNAYAALNQFHGNKGKEDAEIKEGLQVLKTLLKLDKMPERIEAYDISNTGLSENVGSMVVFINGYCSKKEYRRYKVRAVSGNNDYLSMQEVIFRRFRNHNTTELSFPNLILVDGGLGHINAVCEILKQNGISVPVAGMVKDDRHKTRGLIYNREEISLNDKMTLLKLITAIQDEAHRFAIDYNKKLREKRYKKSILDEIEGIGEKRKKTLIKHFGSVSRIKNAGVDDLASVEGISESVAKKIYEFFNN